MREVELLIIGSGPAGLCAAVSAASSGAKVLVLERSFRPGGQLIKQTHMFFGSESQYASHRGVDIAEILLKKRIGITYVLYSSWLIGPRNILQASNR